VTVAAEEVKAAEDRRVRIEQGENMPLPGKPPTLKELGFTPARIRHARAMASLTEEQFEQFLVFAQPSARQDYGRLRRFLRAEASKA
jgi:hypothetical protein